jgi:hypothetical protein
VKNRITWVLLSFAAAWVIVKLLSGCAAEVSPTLCDLACTRMRDLGCGTSTAFEDDCNATCPDLVQKHIFSEPMLKCINALPESATCEDAIDCGDAK